MSAHRILTRTPRAGGIAQSIVVGAIGLLILTFVAGLLSDPTSAVARWVPISVVAAGFVACAVRATTVRDDHGAWLVMSVAILVWTLGAVADAINHAPPAAADGVGAVCRVAFYPLAYLSLVQLVRGRITRFASALWLDGLIGALAVAAVGMGVVVQPVIESAEGDLGQLVMRLILPLGDMLLLAFVAGVMALNSWRPGRAWVAIGVALGLLALTHSIELTFGVDEFAGVELTTLMWPIALALIGLAAWRPSTLATQLRLEGWGLLVGPTLFGWLTVALVAYGNFVELGALGLLLATVTLLLVMIRTGLTFKENIAIAEELRAEVAQSSRDPLTGLINHRSFHQKLAAAVDRAHASGSDLSLILFDIDDFRPLNDRLGHQAGDAVLRAIALAIHDRLRNEDHLGRIGGEEFACLLPATSGTAAWLVADRARALIERMDFGEAGSVTISAGVCDLTHASSAGDLLRLTDGALYWAKSHGRNTVARYHPDVIDVLSAEDRAAQAERARTLSAVAALARAVDAKDTTTQQHSNRVSAIAGDIAGRLGWSHDQIVLLREAALVHDVGKIGVPDSILLKPTPLLPQERAVMQTHAGLGAQIVRDVLTEEQTAWVRSHHERWDGHGYPDTLRGSDIPEGALILAVADSWDAMTADRAYRKAMDADRAIAILREGAGSQWWTLAVTAALELYADGILIPSLQAEANEPAGHDDPWRSASVAAAEIDSVALGEDLAAAVADGALDGDRIEPVLDELLA